MNKQKSTFKRTEEYFNEEQYVQRGQGLSVEVKKFPPHRKYEFEKFFSFLGVGKGGKLIELGSGYGRFVLPLLKLGYSITAVDISRRSLQLLKQEAKKNKIDKNLKILQSDFTKKEFDKKFDGAFCVSTFHLLANSEKKRIQILKNLIYSVKPGGVVLVIEPNPLNPLFYIFYNFTKDAKWNVEKNFLKSSESNLIRIFKKLELENIEVKHVGFLPLRFIGKVPLVQDVNNIVNTLPFINKFSSFTYIRGYRKQI